MVAASLRKPASSPRQGVSVATTPIPSSTTTENGFHLDEASPSPDSTEPTASITTTTANANGLTETGDETENSTMQALAQSEERANELQAELKRVQIALGVLEAKTLNDDRKMDELRKT